MVDLLLDQSQGQMADNKLIFPELETTVGNEFQRSLKLSQWYKSFIPSHYKVGLLCYNTRNCINHLIANLLNGAEILLYVYTWNFKQALETISNCVPDVLLIDDKYLLENKLTEADFKNLGVKHILNVDSQAHEVESLISPFKAEDYVKPEIDIDSPVFIFYSSGSTNTPKGVVHSHFTFLNYVVLWRIMSKQLYSGRITSILYTPIGYIGGVFITMSSFAFVEQTLVVPICYKTLNYATNVSKHKISSVIVTPYMGYDLIKCILSNKLDVSNLKQFGVAGQAFDYHKFRAQVNLINPEIIIKSIYTSTELLAAPIVLGNDADFKDGLNPTGRILPLPGYTLKLGNCFFDTDIDKEVGEIMVKGPSVFKEYYNDADLSSASFDGDFFKTGDLAYIDNGMLFIVDRCKDVIIHKGYNINSKEIEEIIGKVAGVLFCVVIGELHETFGEIPVAVCQFDIEHYDAQQVMDTVNNTLSGYKKIFKVYKTDHLPVIGTSMKLDKRTARLELKQDKYQEVCRIKGIKDFDC